MSPAFIVDACHVFTIIRKRTENTGDWRTGGGSWCWPETGNVTTHSRHTEQRGLPCVSSNHRSSHSSAVVVVVAAAITSLSPAGDNVTHRPRNFVTLNTRVTRVWRGMWRVLPCHTGSCVTSSDAELHKANKQPEICTSYIIFYYAGKVLLNLRWWE